MSLWLFDELVRAFVVTLSMFLRARGFICVCVLRARVLQRVPVSLFQRTVE